MVDTRTLLVAGGVAILGVALLVLTNDDVEASPAIAAANVGGSAAAAPASGAKRSGSSKTATKAEDDDDAWNPGGENEPNADDAQQWHWLQQDLDRMIDSTRPKARKRLDAEGFRDQYLEATVKYLELDSDERTKFEEAASGALTAIGDARSAMQTAQEDTPYDEDDPDSIEAWKDAQATFKDQQSEAAEQLLAAVPVRARSTLLREEALRWVVRYDFGMQHAGRAASR